MLERVLEPEVMDTPEEATAYDSMDHSAVNTLFIIDLLNIAKPLTESLIQQNKKAEEADEIPLSIEEISGKWGEVLDVGTGTALQPIELCQQSSVYRVMAVDAAEEMLALARNNIEIASMNDRIMLDLVDAKELPFEDARFDIVMSNSIVHHIPEPLHVLREAARVVAADGLIFFRDLLRPSDEATLQALVQTYAGEANEHQQTLFAQSLRAALTVEEVQERVEELGFAPETVTATSDRHWTWVARGLV